jgi:hypothetical protein
MRERDVPLRAMVVERECSEHFLKTCARVGRAREGEPGRQERVIRKWADAGSG